MLHGVDVHARYQAGLVASALPGVFDTWKAHQEPSNE